MTLWTLTPSFFGFIIEKVTSVLLIILIIRYRHSSWDSPSGLIMLGGDGYKSRWSTEKIREDGTSSLNFRISDTV